MAIDRLALCVGINEYAREDARLSGCVNDATDWSVFLQQYAYTPLTLLDGEAKRSVLLGCLENLVSRLGYRDRLVVTFSGHGSYISDYSGDEADRRDEVWVTQEMSFISDDDLERIFSKKPFGSRITVLSDSCHSGSVNKWAQIRPLAFSTKRRFVPPETLHVSNYYKPQGRTFTGSRYSTLISGCADNEYSYDAWFGTRPNGAFTRKAIDTYVPLSSYRDWHARIRNVLPNDDYPQTPQLQASYYQSRLMTFA